MTTRRGLIAGGTAAVLAGSGGAYGLARDVGSMEAYAAATAHTRRRLAPAPETLELLRFATLAPSGHNTQPWTFKVRPDRISLLPDLARRTPVVDPDDHHLFVSLGCASENLSLACGARGMPGEMHFDPSGDGSAVFEFARGTPESSPLFEAIPARQSCRNDYDARPLSAQDLHSLANAAGLPGVDLVLIVDRPRIGQVRDLILEGNKEQMADAAFIRELRTWMRFSPRRALETGDGLFSATSGNPVLPEWLGPAAFKLAFKASSENDKYARQIASSAGLAVFVAKTEDHEGWIQVGRAAQRFALQATALGLKCAFLNQPVEVARLRPELAKLIGMPRHRPDLVMRFGRGPDLPYSARRPVSASLL